MNYWGFDDDVDTRFVRPARDAERSEETLASNNRRSRGESFTHEVGDTTDAQLASGRSYAPVGVFDSGAGGLTILSALRQELSQESYIYIGDTAHCPYGVRTDAEITDLSLNACRFLVEQGVKLIVVACNTASQAALNTLRATISVPIVGVVPAVKPAARATQRGQIGIAATNQAVKAAYLRQLIDDFAEGIHVYAVGCPELVTLVEQGELDGPHVEAMLQQAFAPLLAHDIDVLVLGCTHFPALRPAIERVVGEQVRVIDSGQAIARRTHSVLETEGIMYPSEWEQHRQGELQVWCTGDALAFSDVANKILGYSVQVSQIHL